MQVIPHSLILLELLMRQVIVEMVLLRLLQKVINILKIVMVRTIVVVRLRVVHL